jgi:PAS domain S-box-containing protein
MRCEPGRDRVLVLAPTGRDAALTQAVLAQAGIGITSCAGFDDLLQCLSEGAAVVLITEEVFAAQSASPIADWLARQPPWSDLPVIVLVDRGRPDEEMLPELRKLQASSNVTLIERPVSIATLVSSVRSALRARRRQYEVNDALDALAESERRYRTLAEALPQLVWTADPDGNFDYLNRQWIEFTGIPEKDQGGWAWLDKVIHPDDVQRTRTRWTAAVHDRNHYDLEHRIRRADGRYFWFKVRATPIRDDDGRIVRWFGTCTEISEIVEARETLSHNQVKLENLVAERTRSLSEANNRLMAEMAERERAQEALRQAQKMEAVGQLTGGIAHDFNNLLTAVIGSLYMAERRVQDPEVHRLMSVGRRAAQRGATLTQQLLAFSRKQRLDPRPVNLNRLIEEATEMLVRTIGTTVRIDTILAADLWPALVDSTQIELVLLNLAINSRDAMPDGGRITIQTRNAGAAEVPGQLAAGDYVMIMVTDAGVGMPPEVLAHAIEPFFTTKEVGKGSGLGLSMVHGVATQSGGGLTIESQPGTGTTVRVYLPRSIQAAGSPARDAQSEPARGRATILVVDDDPEVRDIAVSGLEHLGYLVLAAANGPQALDMLTRGAKVDLLLVDIAMAGMNGVEVVRRARERQPGLPAILVTGYANVDMFSPTDGDVIVQKPYSFEWLAECVAAALRRATPQAGARTSSR